MASDRPQESACSSWASKEPIYCLQRRQKHVFLRSFREKSRIVFIRTKFPPNYVIKIRLIFFTLFSALLNHIKLLRTDIRLPVATKCVFMTFLKQFSTLLRRDPSAACGLAFSQLAFSQAIIGHCMSASA